MRVLITAAEASELPMQIEGLSTDCTFKINHKMHVIGVGKVRAYRNLIAEINRFKPDRVLHVGTAASLTPDVQIGAVQYVIATYDGDITDLNGRGIGNPDIEIDPSSNLLEMESSVSWTSDVALFDRADCNDKVASIDYHADLYDMEDFSVALACYDTHTPVDIYRVVVNHPGDTRDTYRKNASECSSTLETVIMTYLSKLARLL